MEGLEMKASAVRKTATAQRTVRKPTFEQAAKDQAAKKLNEQAKDKAAEELVKQVLEPVATGKVGQSLPTASKAIDLAKPKTVEVKTVKKVEEPLEQAKAKPKFRHFNKINKYNPATKKNPDPNGIDGLVIEKTTKWGAVIRAWNGLQAGFDVQPGMVMTASCETHNIKSFHKAWKLAAYASAHPDTFCPECKKQMEAYEAGKKALAKKAAEKKADTEAAPSTTLTDTAKQSAKKSSKKDK
jgi:hypothetical protein